MTVDRHHCGQVARGSISGNYFFHETEVNWTILGLVCLKQSAWKITMCHAAEWASAPALLDARPIKPKCYVDATFLSGFYHNCLKGNEIV